MENKKIRDFIKNSSKKHIEKLIHVAEQNTKRNEDNLTVVKMDDVWREEN